MPDEMSIRFWGVRGSQIQTPVSARSGRSPHRSAAAIVPVLSLYAKLPYGLSLARSGHG